MFWFLRARSYVESFLISAFWQHLLGRAGAQLNPGGSPTQGLSRFFSTAKAKAGVGETVNIPLGAYSSTTNA